MDVFEEALEQGLDGIVTGPLCDPEAVAALYAAGVGATVSALRRQQDCARATARERRPRARLTGQRARDHRRRVRVSGSDLHGPARMHGPHCGARTGAARVLVTERTMEPLGHRRVQSVGVDPRGASSCILKSTHVLPAGVRADRGRSWNATAAA